ncbi:MAG: hypothetical protein JW884_11795 [Deltaproteobacteria bacterium]|nr:hypothetical protein [Deltaproteobacteria bacterium]
MKVKSRLTIGIAMIIAVTALAAASQAFELGARGSLWMPDLSAAIRVDKAGVVGTMIDLDNDLDVGNSLYPALEVFGGLGKHHFRGYFAQASYSGEKTIAKNIVFSGVAYPAGTFVKSEADVRLMELEYQYDLLDLENVLAGFSLGVLGKVTYWEGETKLRAPSAGIASDESFQAPIPMVGLSLHVGLLADILEARARVAGMTYSGSTFYEGLVDISLTPFPFLDIHGGYKFMKFDVEDLSDVYANFEFAGPYAAVTISF